MTKEKAINLLKQVNEILINSFSWLEDIHEPLNQAFDMAVKALEQQPTQSWIPISERLPRQEVEVLTFNEHGFIEIQSLEDGYWENQHGDCTDLDDNNVIAWQPLPKPYVEKRGSEDDSNKKHENANRL